MAHYLHLAYGSLLMTLAGASAYVLCSADVLENATVFLIR